MKPTIIRNRMMFMAPLHLVSKQLGAPLSKELHEKYRRGTARVIEGDTVKVLRGEFKGIEGKITHVSTEKRGIAIEGIKREKLKGGNVDIYIHPSNVVITALNLEDKWRQNRLEGKKTKTTKPPQPQEQKEDLKLEKSKEQKERLEEKKKEPRKEVQSKNHKANQKDTKTNGKTNKKEKSAKSKKKEDK
jgi:large subunit ribosomal protein L24